MAVSTGPIQQAASVVSAASNLTKVGAAFGATGIASAAVLGPMALALPALATQKPKAGLQSAGAKPSDTVAISNINFSHPNQKNSTKTQTVNVTLADGRTVSVQNVNPKMLASASGGGTVLKYDPVSGAIYASQGNAAKAAQTASGDANAKGLKLGGDTPLEVGGRGTASSGTVGMQYFTGVVKQAAPTPAPTGTPGGGQATTTGGLPTGYNQPTSGKSRPVAPTPEQMAPIKEDDVIQAAGQQEVAAIQDQYGFDDTIATPPESLLTVLGGAFSPQVEGGMTKRRRGQRGDILKQTLGG